MPEIPPIHRGTVPCPVCHVEPGQPHVDAARLLPRSEQVRPPNRPLVLPPNRPDTEL
jgi:hypothetical protein